MRNVSNKEHCYGCGACVPSCPKKCISIKKNAYGFYIPTVTIQDCINCGICSTICPHNDIDVLNHPERIERFYAGWSSNTDVRLKSSSGGVIYELISHLIQKGYKACVVRYNKDKKLAEHYIAEDVEELAESLGSKYIPSYTEAAFNSFNRNEKYVIVGTPCQIDGIRRVLRKKRQEENCIFIDFFCHGIPSLNMWAKYLDSIHNPVEKIRWRDKTTGWHDSWAITFEKTNGEFFRSRWKDKDLFYEMFLGDFCFNLSCHKNCKYKGVKSAADIRAGDFWGEKYSDDESGTSAVIALTKQGDAILHNTKSIILKNEVKESILNNQLKTNPKLKPSANFCRWALKYNFSIKTIYSIAKTIDIFYSIPTRVSNKIKNLIKK